MDVAYALKEVRNEFGPLHHIVGKGTAAKTVTEYYKQVRIFISLDKNRT